MGLTVLSAGFVATRKCTRGTTWNYGQKRRATPRSRVPRLGPIFLCDRGSHEGATHRDNNVIILSVLEAHEVTELPPKEWPPNLLVGHGRVRYACEVAEEVCVVAVVSPGVPFLETAPILGGMEVLNTVPC